MPRVVDNGDSRARAREAIWQEAYRREMDLLRDPILSPDWICDRLTRIKELAQYNLACWREGRETSRPLAGESPVETEARRIQHRAEWVGTFSLVDRLLKEIARRLESDEFHSTYKPEILCRLRKFRNGLATATANPQIDGPDGEEIVRICEHLDEAIIYAATSGASNERGLAGGADPGPANIRKPRPSMPEKPQLNKTDDRAAKYIRENPGCKGDSVAYDIAVTPEHFRSRIVPKLKKHGFYNHGAGYYPPRRGRPSAKN